MSAAIEAARAAGDWAKILAQVPYATWLGISVERAEGQLVARMRFAEHLVGNPTVPALHGGTVGALLETIALLQVIADGSPALPKTINLTIDYLRPAKLVDTLAQATVTKQGRRVVNVHATAWHEGERDRPIATAMAHFLVAAEG